MGLPDPRTEGSGNPGATNVLRLGNRKAAAFTLLGDSLKGLIPVLFAQFLHSPDAVLAAVGLAAFLGHLYPVFFGFRGGKGVATALGVLLGLSPWLGGAAVATWGIVFALSRVSSLSALAAALLAPVYAWWLTPTPPLFGAVAIMVVLLVWRHRSNIRKLWFRQEDRLGGVSN